MAAKTRDATELLTQRLQYFSERYSRILREGRKELPLVSAKPAGQRGRVKQHKLNNLHDRIWDHKIEVLALRQSGKVAYPPAAHIRQPWCWPDRYIYLSTFCPL
jgi:hypothetical protein